MIIQEMSGIWYESDVSAEDSLEDRNKPEENNPASVDKWQQAHIVTCCSPENGAKKKTEWLSGSWPLKAFDGTLPTHKRKAEWVRFRDQFERIVSCKAAVDSVTKLTGMKIFAGDYLLNIIEMQEKLIPEQSNDVYEDTIKALNKFFNQTCDTTKERMIFREMRMDAEEAFVDWVLKLELQAKFCEFGVEQRKEEFVQALIRRSVPVIAEKLYEMSHIWDNDIEKIISYGKHLDYMRAEAKEANDNVKTRTALPETAEDVTGGESQYKVVNALHSRRHKTFSNRFEPYQRSDGNRYASRSRPDAHPPQSGRRSGFNCHKCGTSHGPRDCKAFRAKCFNCGIVGHFSEFCRAPRGNHGKPGNSRHNDLNGNVKEQARMINQVSFENTDD